MAPKAPRPLTTVERFVFKTSDSSTAQPKADHAEEDNALYSKEHGNEAHELHRSEDALISARRDEEDPKLRELLRAMEREHLPPVRRMARIRHPRPNFSSSHQCPQHCVA